MKVGLQLPQLMAQHVDRATVRRFILNAEQQGFDSFWVQDHFLWPHAPQTGYAGREGAPIPDAYRHMLAPLELLAFTAALTERAQIGTSVLVTAYHSPARLAQQLSTLDVLSDGRVLCGLGLGWNKDEYDQFGTPFKSRGRRMTDFVRALKSCWQPDPVEYHGRFFEIPSADLSPKPVQRDANGAPAIPILLGLSSPEGLERVAELADGWNPAGRPAAGVVEGLSAIQRRAEELGRTSRLPAYMRVFVIPADRSAQEVQSRPFGAISWRGTVASMKPLVAEARDAGIDHLIIDTSFSAEFPDRDAWPAQVDYLAPLVDVAHAGVTV